MINEKHFIKNLEFRNSETKLEKGRKSEKYRVNVSGVYVGARLDGRYMVYDLEGNFIYCAGLVEAIATAQELTAEF